MLKLLRQKITAKGIVAAAATLMGLYLCVILIQGFAKFTLAEMDWNSDRRTSIFEILSAADVGRRESQSNPTCTEYFALKDGGTIKTVCGGSKQ